MKINQMQQIDMKTIPQIILLRRTQCKGKASSRSRFLSLSATHEVNFTVTFARTFDFEVNSVFVGRYEVDVELWLS